MKFVRYVVVVALGCALAACAPGGTSSPPVSGVPTSAPTPTSTPTPEWSAEEQAAIDAVQRYLEVWTSIGQDLVASDWNKIRDVASDPAANNALDLWVSWAQHDWHLVGSPTFTPDYVTPGATDYLGDRYHVHGCYSLEGSYLADPTGKSAGDPRRLRTSGSFLVLHLAPPTRPAYYLVIEETVEENPC